MENCDQISIWCDRSEIGMVSSYSDKHVEFMPYRGHGHYTLATRMEENAECVVTLIIDGVKRDILIVEYTNGIAQYVEIDSD